jgi:hypothetical protein
LHPEAGWYGEGREQGEEEEDLLKTVNIAMN